MFKLKNCLENHKITERQRNKMVDWIIEVLDIFNQSDQTVFRALILLDMFLKKTSKVMDIRDLHLMGVVAIFLASKFEEIKVIKFKSILADICKYKFSKTEIMNAEKSMCFELGFVLNPVTVWEYTASILALVKVPSPFLRPIQKYSILLQKMFMYCYDIHNVYSIEELAVYSLLISMKLFERSNSKFSFAKYFKRILYFSKIDENQILDNLNFLREFACNFHRKFPENNLQINSTS